MDYYKEIKEKLQEDEVYEVIKDYSKNKHRLDTYYEVGKLLIEAQGGEERAKYGNFLIKEYSKKLQIDIGKKFDYKTLLKIRKFYLFAQKVATVSRQLTWSHYVELLKFDNFNVINYYIEISIKHHLGVRELRERIKSKEYERLPEETKNKLITKEEIMPVDNLKNPILIHNTSNKLVVTHKMLSDMIMENIEEFLLQLGNGFTFIKREYRIKIGDNYNYIDFLLFNVEYNCYVVIELKTRELKKEDIGQTQVYMNYINKYVKKAFHDKTIGIILVKKNNKFIMEYCSDERIFSTSYVLI